MSLVTEGWNNKKVIVVGLAKSGLSTLKALKEIGSEVTINDVKGEEALKDIVEDLKGLYDHCILGGHPTDFTPYDLMVISPGIPLELPFVKAATEQGLEIIGELELAYRLNSKCSYIGITGTNGKTTTTTWVGEIYKAAGRDARIVGNIGLPAVSQVFDANQDTVMVTEVSSFQLETIHKFNPHISAILNITPDHLNRHKTMENYIDAKARIFENQSEADHVVLNGDNQLSSELMDRCRGKVHFFSKETEPESGVFISDGVMMVKLAGETRQLVNVDEIFLPGEHNLENAMAAALIALLDGIPDHVVVDVLKQFRGVAHRIEYVDTIEGVTYYNDSKGTNPDASVQAVKAMKQPTVLIAGGMDKGSVFDEFIDSFTSQIKHLVLLGETKESIAETARRKGFDEITLVADMEEAVDKASTLAGDGWNVLLSPACASWDMYSSFEVRGEHFKSCVSRLRR